MPSSHGEDFTRRCPAPNYSEDDYARERRNMYPTSHRYTGHGFPPPQMTGGYDAEAQWDKVKEVQLENQTARRAYAAGGTAARDTLASMGTQERRYYTEFTGGMLPTDHARLKPMAQTWQETAYNHGVEREALYNGAPLLYDTAASQRGHHNSIYGHYAESDRATQNYDRHGDWEKWVNLKYSFVMATDAVPPSSDPESTEVDAYGRPIPHGRRRMPHPYPYRDPIDNTYYSGEYGLEPPAFTTKVVQKKQKRRGH
ncbi:MAG: hypothetical protein Q9180_007478 [Flavoplaca navasiana]